MIAYSISIAGLFLILGALFVAYTMLSAMLIRQMLIGVLCDVVTRVNAEQRDATAIGLATNSKGNQIDI